MKAQHYNDTLPQAYSYAAADKSDPFALSRAIAHIRQGICDDGPRGEDCRYKADAYLETRRLPNKPDGSPGDEYQIVAYKNVQRP